MNVIWTPLTEEELAALKEGDSIVTHASSKDAFQFTRLNDSIRNSSTSEK
jgi:hypothetical protein